LELEAKKRLVEEKKPDDKKFNVSFFQNRLDELKALLSSKQGDKTRIESLLAKLQEKLNNVPSDLKPKKVVSTNAKISSEIDRLRRLIDALENIVKEAEKAAEENILEADYIQVAQEVESQINNFESKVRDIEKKYGSEDARVQKYLAALALAKEMQEESTFLLNNKNYSDFDLKIENIFDLVQYAMEDLQKLQEESEDQKYRDDALRDAKNIWETLRRIIAKEIISKNAISKTEMRDSDFLRDEFFRAKVALENAIVGTAQNFDEKVEIFAAAQENLLKKLGGRIRGLFVEEIEKTRQNYVVSDEDKNAKSPAIKNEQSVPEAMTKDASTASDRTTNTPIDTAAQDTAREIERRREIVETYEKNFLRHIIETMPEDFNLAQEIRKVHQILKDALKDIHDTNRFETLCSEYEKQAALLIEKIKDESSAIPVEASDIVEILDRRVIENREREVSDCENELESVMQRAKKELPNYNFNDELKKIDGQIKLALANISDSNKFETHITAVRESIAQINNAIDQMLAPKKSFWAKTKEKLFGIKEKAVAAKDVVLKKEVGKAVVKAAYDSATSVLGIKLVTDAGRWLINGEGDLADYFKGKKRAGKDQKDIHTAYQNLLTSFEKSKKGEALSGGEQVSKRIEQLKAKIENTNLSAEAKKQILERLWAISIKHQENSKKVEASRDQEVKKLLDGYIHSKIEGVKIAKDALNLALTATGLSVLRGIMYAGTSLLEKARKGSKEFAIKTSGTLSTESENTFIKNALVKSAQETVRALRGRGATEGASATTRVIDFIKAAGVVARVFGITKLAFMDGDHNQTMDQLIQGVEKNGWTHIITEVPHNLAANLEKTGQMVGLDRVWNKIAGTEEATQSLGAVFQNSENSSPLDVSDMVSRLEAGSADSVYAFAAEHQLSERSADYLAQFDSLKDHPESLNRILESSHVGAGVRSHFTGSKLDNIIEAGGERRAVIFEELWKNDRVAAINFLNKQGFSRMHLSHFAAFADKKGNVDFVKFVENYNPDDKKMSLALFRAMQGKENTELANAGLVRAATADHTGRTVRIKGDVMYFGLDEKGEPILSGGGQVAVRETFLNKNNKMVLSASQANEGLNTDDALRANANTIRDMKSDGSSFEGNTQNVLSELSPKNVKQFMQGEIDKARFAKMGEEHIDAISKPVGSNGQNVNSFDITHLRDKKGMPIERSAFADQSLESPVPENAFNTAPAAKSNREVVGKTVQIFEAGKAATVEGGRSEMTAQISVSEQPVVNSSQVSEGISSVSRSEDVLVENPNSLPRTAPNPETKSTTAEVSSDTVELTKVQKEAVDRLDKLFTIVGDEIAQKMDQLVFKNGADLRIEEAIANEPAFKNFGKYFEAISNRKQPGLTNKEITDFTNFFVAFQNKDPQWYNLLQSDELRLMLDPNVAESSMLANNSHSLRIWDQDKQQELFISNPEYTFVLKGASLLKMDGERVVDTWKNYKEALLTAQQSSNMNR
jgi:hypothetical protein